MKLPELGETFVYLCGVMMGFMAFVCICSKPLPLYLREGALLCASQLSGSFQWRGGTTSSLNYVPSRELCSHAADYHAKGRFFAIPCRGVEATISLNHVPYLFFLAEDCPLEGVRIRLVRLKLKVAFPPWTRCCQHSAMALCLEAWLR